GMFETRDLVKGNANAAIRRKSLVERFLAQMEAALTEFSIEQNHGIYELVTQNDGGWSDYEYVSSFLCGHVNSVSVDRVWIQSFSFLILILIFYRLLVGFPCSRSWSSGP